jgi:hypothetical protein
MLDGQAWYTRPSTSSARSAGPEGWVWVARPWKPDPDLQDPHPYHELWAWHPLWASLSFMSQFHRFESLPFILSPLWTGCVETWSELNCGYPVSFCSEAPCFSLPLTWSEMVIWNLKACWQAQPSSIFCVRATASCRRQTIPCGVDSAVQLPSDKNPPHPWITG